METAHAVLGSGAVLQYHIIAAAFMAATPWWDRVSFERDLRITDHGASVRWSGLRLYKECALIFDGEVTDGTCVYAELGRVTAKKRRRMREL